MYKSINIDSEGLQVFYDSILAWVPFEEAVEKNLKCSWRSPVLDSKQAESAHIQDGGRIDSKGVSQASHPGDESNAEQSRTCHANKGSFESRVHFRSTTQSGECFELARSNSEKVTCVLAEYRPYNINKLSLYTKTKINWNCLFLLLSWN